MHVNYWHRVKKKQIVDDVNDEKKNVFIQIVLIILKQYKVIYINSFEYI